MNTVNKCSSSVAIRELLNESMKITLIHYLMVTKINHRTVSFRTIYYYLAFWSSFENTKYVSLRTIYYLAIWSSFENTKYVLFRYDRYTVYNDMYYFVIFVTKEYFEKTKSNSITVCNIWYEKALKGTAL